MYLVTWIDPKTREPRKMKVSTLSSVRQIVNTLKAYNGDYFPVESTYVAPRRVRELVIVFEK
jgi:hypothetical protein